MATIMNDDLISDNICTSPWNTTTLLADFSASFFIRERVQKLFEHLIGLFLGHLITSLLIFNHPHFTYILERKRETTRQKKGGRSVGFKPWSELWCFQNLYWKHVSKNATLLRNHFFIWNATCGLILAIDFLIIECSKTGFSSVSLGTRVCDFHTILREKRKSSHLLEFPYISFISQISDLRLVMCNT